MYKIQANATGTRQIEVSEAHLATLKKFALLQNLIDSNGIIDEKVLEKLRLNIRSLIESNVEDCKELLDLCLDVIYHKDMKAYGLHELILLYVSKMPNQE